MVLNVIMRLEFLLPYRLTSLPRVYAYYYVYILCNKLYSVLLHYYKNTLERMALGRLFGVEGDCRYIPNFPYFLLISYNLRFVLRDLQNHCQIKDMSFMLMKVKSQYGISKLLPTYFCCLWGTFFARTHII